MLQGRPNPMRNLLTINPCPPNNPCNFSFTNVQALLAQQETVGLLAKFGHDVVTAFESVPLYIPAMVPSDR